MYLDRVFRHKTVPRLSRGLSPLSRPVRGLSFLPPAEVVGCGRRTGVEDSGFISGFFPGDDDVSVDQEMQEAD